MYEDEIVKYENEFDNETRLFANENIQKVKSYCGHIQEINFDAFTGSEFEYWCASLLKRNGFSNVEVTKASGDQGVDILAEKNELKYAIQCKCYSTDIGNSPVQEVFAGKSMYGCQIGVVMTNRFFTKGAKELAEATGVLLWDRQKLFSLLQSSENNITSPHKEPFSYKTASIKNRNNILLSSIHAIIDSGFFNANLLESTLHLTAEDALLVTYDLMKLGIISSPNSSGFHEILMNDDELYQCINTLQTTNIE